MKPTKELIDSIRPGDIVWINNWATPFCVKCVSENYFIITSEEDGERIYSICSKNPFCGENSVSIKHGDFYCGPVSCQIEKFFKKKPKNIYAFSDKRLNKKFLSALENGEIKILNSKMIVINEIAVLRSDYNRGHSWKFIRGTIYALPRGSQKSFIPFLSEKIGER